MQQRSNSETSATHRFHSATKYIAFYDEAGEEQSVMGTPPETEDPIWQEDWSLEPFPFKVYETLDPLAIPRAFPPSSMPALEAIARTGAEPQGKAMPDRATLARIGLLSNGLLNRQSTTRSGATIEFRTAGATGARYHLELYFICADLPDLAAGIYHYAAQDHSLRQLRAGDFRGVLLDATGGEPSVAQAPVLLAMTSTFWRNAWRYKARAYRHTFWDAGTSLSHVLAVSASAEMPTKLVMGYADAPVNALLGVDGAREATVALCAIGRTDAPVPPASSVSPLDYPTRAISPREVVFPHIPAMHGASALMSGAEAAAWRTEPLRRTPPEPTGALIPLQPLPTGELPPAPVEEIIFRRRSTRHYDTDTLFACGILDAAQSRIARLRCRLPRSRRATAARLLPDRQRCRRVGPRCLSASLVAQRHRATQGRLLP